MTTQSINNKINVGDVFNLRNNLNDEIYKIKITKIGSRLKTFDIEFIDNCIYKTDKERNIRLKNKSFKTKDIINFDNFDILFNFKKNINGKYIIFSFSNEDRQLKDILLKKLENNITDNNITDNIIIMSSNNFFNEWIQSKANLKPLSVKNYQNQFKFLSRILLDDDSINFNTLPNTIDYLLNPSKVINKFEDRNNKIISSRTLKLYISIIQQLLKFHNRNDLYEIYNKKIMLINEELEEVKLDHIKSTPQLKNWIDWNTLKEKYNLLASTYQFNKNPPLVNIKFVILSLLILFPVRRISDLRLLKLISVDKITNKKIGRSKYELTNSIDLDDNFNYLNYVTKSKTYQLIFLNYKTNKLYGSQVFDIENNELTNILTKFISHSKIQNNDLLFSKSLNIPYNQADLTNFIIRYTQTIFNKSLNPSLFRTIYCSYIYGLNPTNREALECSTKLAHSVDEARNTYQKK